MGNGTDGILHGERLERPREQDDLGEDQMGAPPLLSFLSLYLLNYIKFHSRMTISTILAPRRTSSSSSARVGGSGGSQWRPSSATASIFRWLRVILRMKRFRIIIPSNERCRVRRLEWRGRTRSAFLSSFSPCCRLLVVVFPLLLYEIFISYIDIDF